MFTPQPDQTGAGHYVRDKALPPGGELDAAHSNPTSAAGVEPDGISGDPSSVPLYRSEGPEGLVQETPGPSARTGARVVGRWEPPLVYMVTLAVLALISPRMTTFLSPLTGDEPFYAMTALSIWNDYDINECNNYRQGDYAALYPATVAKSMVWPFGWQGWTGAPYPLPPHAAQLVSLERRCSFQSASDRTTRDSRPPPAGSRDELYSKHGVGLSLLVTLPYALGGRTMVVFLLNIFGALVAVNVYLLAREGTGKVWPALLTWVALSFTVPLMPFSFLIFPELPAALLVVYAFRRIWLGRNNALQLTLVALCMAFLPWLHYRFVPLSAGLFLFFLYRLYRRPGVRGQGSGVSAPQQTVASDHRPLTTDHRPLTTATRLRALGLVLAPIVVSAALLLGYFYFLYGQITPNPNDHAGTSDLAGTARGIAGSFVDEQWGLFVYAPVYILAIVGVVLMLARREWRTDLLWIGIVFVPYFGLVANYAQWWGEWCPPARYLTSILPLLALPFALALDNIRGVTYKAIYAALLALSLAATAGFVFQPKWMYNQPNGQAELFLHGVPGLLGLLYELPSNLRPNIDLVNAFPSFVVPYFGYLLQGQSSGDYWSAQAWEKSQAPFSVVLLIVLVSLALAFMSRYSGRRSGRLKPLPARAPVVVTAPIEAPHSQVDFRLLGLLWVRGGLALLQYCVLRIAYCVLPVPRAVPVPVGSRNTQYAIRNTQPVRLPTTYAAITGDEASTGDTRAGPPALAGGNGSEALADDAIEAGTERTETLGLAEDNEAHGDTAIAAGNGSAHLALAPAPEPVSAPDLTTSNGAGSPPSPGPPGGGVARPPVRRRRRLGVALGSAWRMRSVWLALMALGIAGIGQGMLVGQMQMVLSIRLYALGILLIIVAWLGTYKNKSFLLSPARPTVVTTLPSRAKARAVRRGMASLWGLPRWVTTTLRWALALAALALNIYSVWWVLRYDFSSPIGIWGWLASVVLLLVAFLGHRTRLGSDADAGIQDVEDRTDLRLPRRAEIAIIVGIFLLALALRFYRLDDWTTGVHGDEGEVGMDALAILENGPVSPFGTGWFAQPNVYYWSIAISMKLFGTGLLGLRMFSAVAGTLVVLPVYGLARMWFGPRAAILAGVFLAISDIAIHFSRAEFSNITTPLFLSTGFFLFFRGLRNKRTWEFVLAGYAFMLTLYFYLGGRLTPFLVGAVLLYLFLFMPLVRLPGVYKQARRDMPGVGRLAAFGKALATQARGVYQYLGHILALVIACICFATPFLAYYLANRDLLDFRTQDKLIVNQPQRMVDQFQIDHSPLYLGLRVPTPEDIYPVLPVVFEHTPLSVQVAADGFWPRAYWRQTAATLSIFTYSMDASSVYTFTGEPIAKPIEAVLIILGIAWAAWRWRDARMAVLSMWFWSAIVVGGILTIDAPYVARLVGIFPAMALFAAILLNKLCAEFVHFAGYARVRFGPWRSTQLPRRSAQFASVLALVALLGYLGVQNFSDYYVRYLGTYPFGEATGTAYFVRQMNEKAAQEGRPKPRYYDLGAHFIYWGYGTNRFLSHGTDGHDMTNPAHELPVIENGDRDVVFMVWPHNSHYLTAIKAYYPGGEEGRFNYGRDPQNNLLFTYYRVKKEELEARRFALATYTPANPANGPIRQQPEYSFGTLTPPPEGINYPTQASWTGGLVAPAFATYNFLLAAPATATLTIDGMTVVSTTAQTPQSGGSVVLARGPHDVTLVGGLPSGTDAVSLTWSAGGTPLTSIARKYLLYGSGKGLLGEIRQFASDPFAEAPPDTRDGTQPPVVLRRVDGFLGFEDSPSVLASGNNLVADWKANLTITDTGKYSFEVNSNGGSLLLIDGKVVVDNRDAVGAAKLAHGDADLDAGTHRLEVRYNWQGGTGYLEVFWSPPGKPRSLLGPDALHADGGAWVPGTVTEPPGYMLAADAPPAATKVKPDSVLGNPGELDSPRGVGVDGQGNVYVGDRGHHRIAVYSPDGKLLRAWGKAPAKTDGPPVQGEFGQIADVAVNGQSVYVLDNQGGLQVFNTNGELQKAYNVAGLGLFSPNGISVGPDGTIYIADTGMSRLVKLPRGDESSPQAFDGMRGSEGQTQAYSKLEQPLDVAVGQGDNLGNVYAVDLKSRVVKFAPDGRFLNQWPVLGGGMDGGPRMAANADASRIYVTDGERSRFAVLNPAQGLVTYLGEPGTEPGQFRSPTGIAVDANGKVYIVDSGRNNVQVFSLDK